MGRMELNGDVVAMASYAPLFAKNGHHSWNPDLIYFDNERAYHPYSYWVQQMYATTTADTAWPVTVEGPSTLRRTLPDTVRLRIAGNAKADLNNLTITTAAGDTIDLGDVAYDGRTIDTPARPARGFLQHRRHRRLLRRQMGHDLICGDIDGKNHNIVSLGRGTACASSATAPPTRSPGHRSLHERSTAGHHVAGARRHHRPRSNHETVHRWNADCGWHGG